MMKARMDKEWCRCGQCGHKMFKSNRGWISGIEIKCSSCGTINTTTQKWIFTFGCGQDHEGHYVVIEGTYGEARDKMVAEYGTEWAFQYSEDEWEESLKKGYILETEL